MVQSEARPGKISEMMLDFARPLLDLIGPPRNINDLRKAFELVTLCWNLPTLERQQDPQATALREHFDSVVGGF